MNGAHVPVLPSPLDAIAFRSPWAGIGSHPHSPAELFGVHLQSLKDDAATSPLSECNTCGAASCRRVGDAVKVETLPDVLVLDVGDRSYYVDENGKHSEEPKEMPAFGFDFGDGFKVAIEETTYRVKGALNYMAPKKGDANSTGHYFLATVEEGGKSFYSYNDGAVKALSKDQFQATVDQYGRVLFLHRDVATDGGDSRRQRKQRPVGGTRCIQTESDNCFCCRDSHNFELMEWRGAPGTDRNFFPVDVMARFPGLDLPGVIVSSTFSLVPQGLFAGEMGPLVVAEVQNTSPMVQAKGGQRVRYYVSIAQMFGGRT